jgi:hypothetical protein
MEGGAPFAGWIYLLSHGSRIKVGYTERLPADRAAHYSRDTGIAWQLRVSYFCVDARTAETDVIRRLDAYAAAVAGTREQFEMPFTMAHSFLRETCLSINRLDGPRAEVIVAEPVGHEGFAMLMRALERHDYSVVRTLTQALMAAGHSRAQFLAAGLHPQMVTKLIAFARASGEMNQAIVDGLIRDPWNYYELTRIRAPALQTMILCHAREKGRHLQRRDILAFIPRRRLLARKGTRRGVPSEPL